MGRTPWRSLWPLGVEGKVAGGAYGGQNADEACREREEWRRDERGGAGRGGAGGAGRGVLASSDGQEGRRASMTTRMEWPTGPDTAR